MKSNDEFQNRVRRNESTKDFLYGQQRNAEVLTGALERRSELMMASDADEQQCRSTMKKYKDRGKKRHGATDAKHSRLKGKEQHSSAHVC